MERNLRFKIDWADDWASLIAGSKLRWLDWIFGGRTSQV